MKSPPAERLAWAHTEGGTLHEENFCSGGGAGHGRATRRLQLARRARRGRRPDRRRGWSGDRRRGLRRPRGRGGGRAAPAPSGGGGGATLAGAAIGAATGAVVGAATAPPQQCARWGWDYYGNRVCVAYYNY
jgi:hypothetical protein